jgi:hypothetical protein
MPGMSDPILWPVALLPFLWAFIFPLIHFGGVEVGWDVCWVLSMDSLGYGRHSRCAQGLHPCA